MRIISNKKIQGFKEKLRDKRIDVALFLSSEPIHDVNIEYFTGFQQTKYHSFSCLLMTQSKMSLITSALEYDRAVKQAEADEVVNLRDYDNSLTKVLKEKLKNVSSVGVIERIFPYTFSRKFPKIKFQDISSIIAEVRSIKEQKEIELIKKSCRIASYGIKVIEKNLSTRITEKELALILEQELIKRGADELAFPTIVVSGKRSAFIHPYPPISDQRIQKGLGLIDYGVRCKGYCSDVTVPFGIGRLSKKQEKIIKTVNSCYQKTVESLKIGVPTWKVHHIAEKIVREKGFEFKHSLGHGLGLNLHDLPSISPKPKDPEELKDWKEIKLKENMVFTIEPGIYVPNIGGWRLENDVLMTKRGVKLLTKFQPIIL